MTVAAIPDPIAAISARVTAIEARFGVMRPGPADRDAGAGRLDFDALLARLTSGAPGASGIRRPASGPGLASTFGYPGLSAGTGPAGGAAAGHQVVNLALEHLGTPYVWGGASPGGFDCSGLVQHVYRRLGVELPRVSAQQARSGVPVASLADARPGDLVAFNSPVDHIGIYAGNGQMVVAPRRGDVVKVQPIYTTPTAIRRILPEFPGGL